MFFAGAADGIIAESGASKEGATSVENLGSETPSTVKIQALRLEYGMKVYLGALEQDFAVSIDKGVITVLFEHDIVFENLQTIERTWQKVKQVVSAKRSFSIFLSQEDVRVEKIKEGNIDGFIIYDNTVQQKTQEGDDERNKSRTIQVTQEYQLGTSDNIMLTFEWESSNVGAAVYARDDKLWVVFDHRATFVNRNTTNFEVREYDLADSASFFSITIPGLKQKFPNIKAYKSDGRWFVALRQGEQKNNEILVLSKPYASPMPKVEIKCSSAVGEPINIKDPDIGDNLSIIPISVSGFGASVERKFVPFRVLPSAQGAVIQRISDDINIKSNLNVATITSTITPLNISDRSGSIRPDGNSAQQDVSVKNSILGLIQYYIDAAPITTKVQDLQLKISGEEESLKRVYYEKQLASLYLANNWFLEAMLVQQIMSKERAYLSDYEKMFLEGMIHFFNRRYKESYENFSGIDTTDIPGYQHDEVKFWQTLLGFIMTDITGDKFPQKCDMAGLFTKQDDGFIKEYPDALRVIIGIRIAEIMIEKNQDAQAEAVLASLERLSQTVQNRNAIWMLQGRIYAKKNDGVQAKNVWSKCIESVEDSKHRAYCMYEQAEYQRSYREIEQSEYASTLEKVLLVWQGDKLSKKVLLHLGDSYYESKNYVGALRAWKKITERYQYSKEAIDLYSKIGRTFIDFFTKHLDKDVSDLQAISLFYEFQDLVPIGPVGDDIVIRLTQHLVALDLLDRAAKILEYQVKNRIQGYKREMVINRLAKIYVMQNLPAMALQLLSTADLYEELPQNLADERRLIEAEALHDNMEDEKAIDLLKDDERPEADAMRAKIYWQQQNWSEFEKFAEPSIYALRQNGNTLSEEEAQTVLKLTISYIMQDKGSLLRGLVQDFDGRVAATNKQDADVMRGLYDLWSMVKNNSVQAIQDLSALRKQGADLLKMLK